MKISKDSWHYRLNKGWSSYYIPTSLCPYFWRTMMILLIYLLIITLGFTIGGVLILGIGAFISAWYKSGFPFDWFPDIDFWEVVKCIGVILGSGLPMTLITFLPMWFKNRKPNKLTPTPKEKDPSLFLEWVKAKKDMLCPLIEFHD